MRGAKGKVWTCAQCLQRHGQQPHRLPGGVVRLHVRRSFRSATTPLRSGQATAGKDEGFKHEAMQEKVQGAMSRRLSEMAEETMVTGSKSDRKMMKEAGFSDELKKQLEERIAQTAFEAANQQAKAVTDMPSYAGKGTQDQAAAEAWKGAESLHDSALRMLDDSHKRLRTPSRAPRLPIKNLRPAPKKNISAADRLANARDKTSIYAISQHPDMTEKEKEQMRKDLKERFTPGARPMPTSLQGLTSLANERIEDAIARGQFKNITRGKGVNTERDYNANSPFLDTTEYFMNKIIQKQEIVPPWIEKQQELVKTVAQFRGRLRNNWKRHAARVISSKGGSLQEQVRKAKSFALAEAKLNPRQARVERLSEIGSDGTLSTVTVEERIAHGVREESRSDGATGQDGNVPATDMTTITVTETSAEDAPQIQKVSPSSPEAATSDGVLPMAYPFRDPEWERTELGYHTLAISELNSLTRSYNLMAPKIAQKPYYTLERELKKCFAEVAPMVADEIEHRARAPTVKIEIVGHRAGGVMEKFGSGHTAKVRDEDYKRKGYGFKEFWRDLFGKDEETRRV